MDPALAALIAQLRERASIDEAPDPIELTRMWLVSSQVPADEAGPGRVYLAEVHASCRLLHTADGLAYLTSPGRKLVGVGFAIPDVGLPGPNDLDRWLDAELAAHASGERPLARSAKWRLQRLSRQLPRAARSAARWSAFVLRNDVSYQPSTTFGVWLDDGRRAAEVVDAATGGVAPVPDDDPFWLRNEYRALALALADAATRDPAPGSPTA